MTSSVESAAPSLSIELRIAAFVVVSKPLTEDDLRSECRAKLAPFKVPKRVVFVDELPHTATGKLLATTELRTVVASRG